VRDPVSTTQRRLEQLWQDVRSGRWTEHIALAGAFGATLFLMVSGVVTGRFGGGGAVGIVTTVGCFALALHRWEWAALLAVFTIQFTEYFEVSIIGDTRVSLWELAALAAMVGWGLTRVQAAQAARCDPPRIRITLMDGAILGITFVQLVANLTEFMRTGTVHYNVKPFEFAFLYILARSMMAKEKTAKAFLVAVVASGVIQATIGTLQHFQVLKVPNLPWMHVPRSHLYWLFHYGDPVVTVGKGSFLHFSNFGFFVSLCWPCAVALALAARSNWHRLFWGLLSAIVFYGILMSYARAAQFGWLLAVVVFLLIVPRGQWVGTARVCAVALLVMAGAIWQWANTSDYASTMNMDGRHLAWTKVLEGFPANPFELVVGRGELASRSEAIETVGLQSIHNAYIQALVDTGVVGLASYCLMGLAMLLPGLWALRADRIGLFEACAAASAACMVMLYFEAYTVAMWTAIGVQPFYMTLAGLSHARHVPQPDKPLPKERGYIPRPVRKCGKTAAEHRGATTTRGGIR